MREDVDIVKEAGRVWLRQVLGSEDPRTWQKQIRDISPYDYSKKTRITTNSQLIKEGENNGQF